MTWSDASGAGVEDGGRRPVDPAAGPLLHLSPTAPPPPRPPAELPAQLPAATLVHRSLADYGRADVRLSRRQLVSQTDRIQSWADVELGAPEGRERSAK